MCRSRALVCAGMFLLALAAAGAASAGIRCLFSDGFEGGDTTAWQMPVRYVVFEGFYNPG